MDSYLILTESKAADFGCRLANITIDIVNKDLDRVLPLN